MVAVPVNPSQIDAVELCRDWCGHLIALEGEDWRGNPNNAVPGATVPVLLDSLWGLLDPAALVVLYEWLRQDATPIIADSVATLCREGADARLSADLIVPALKVSIAMFGDDAIALSRARAEPLFMELAHHEDDQLVDRFMSALAVDLEELGRPKMLSAPDDVDLVTCDSPALRFLAARRDTTWSMLLWASQAAQWHRPAGGRGDLAGVREPRRPTPTIDSASAEA